MTSAPSGAIPGTGPAEDGTTIVPVGAGCGGVRWRLGTTSVPSRVVSGSGGGWGRPRLRRGSGGVRRRRLEKNSALAGAAVE
ncbi:Os03g0630033 [Oryza sativa Japonica Group]|uniref:Os03g0630033 protein n=1 Tax=Oryza sativa subsp. japonica TaxID=39947 RepID=A0A0P0W108_ORYSJ|nr:Os03g0630033 [Oryza sativa Japonica Group]